MATLTAVGGQLYDSGVTDPEALAAALVRKTGVSVLQAASAAAGVISAKGKGIVDTITAPLDALGDVAGVVKDAVDTPVRVAKWLTESGTWVRIGYVIIGAGLLFMGASRLAGGVLAGPLSQVAGVASAVVPAGKVAKAAGAASKVAKVAKG